MDSSTPDETTETAPERGSSHPVSDPPPEVSTDADANGELDTDLPVADDLTQHSGESRDVEALEESDAACGQRHLRAVAGAEDANAREQMVTHRLLARGAQWVPDGRIRVASLSQSEAQTSWLVVVGLRDVEANRDEVCDTLVRAGWDMNALIYPVFVSLTHFDIISTWLSFRTIDSFDTTESLVEFHLKSVEELRTDAEYLRRMRRWIRTFFQQQIWTTEILKTNRDVALHMRLHTGADMMLQTLRVLLWGHGLDANQLRPAVFSKLAQLLEAGSCPGKPVQDYLMMRGAAWCAEWFQFNSQAFFTSRAFVLPAYALTLWSHAVRFFAWSGHYLLQRYTSPAIERQRRVLRSVAIAATAVLVVAVAAIFVMKNWPLTPSPPPAMDRIGAVTGKYYDGTNFRKHLLTRDDPQLSFTSLDSFAPGLPSDNFSIRWEGMLKFPSAGAYELCVNSDDGFKLELNGKELMKEWTVRPARLDCRKVRVRHGWYPFKLEYFEAHDRAVLRLAWRRGNENLIDFKPHELCCKK